MAAARVGRPHGLDGSFHALTRDPELLAVDSVTVAGVERAVVRRAGTAERPILRLAGIESREAADALRGEELLVERPPLEEDEYWAEDLVGCEVAGRGTVVRMLAYPSCDLLELDSGELVPLLRDAIASVDVVARRIVVREEFFE